jgi:hypothetical protein
MMTKTIVMMVGNHINNVNSRSNSNSTNNSNGNSNTTASIARMIIMRQRDLAPCANYWSRFDLMNALTVMMPTTTTTTTTTKLRQTMTRPTTRGKIPRGDTALPLWIASVGSCHLTTTTTMSMMTMRGSGFSVTVTIAVAGSAQPAMSSLTKLMTIMGGEILVMSCY